MFSGKRNKAIMISIEKGCDCLIAIFGVLYSGNFYIPMDINTPQERYNHITDTLNPGLILTTKGTKQKYKDDKTEVLESRNKTGSIVQKFNKLAV